MTLENATSLKKSGPGPPNISDEDVSCTAPAAKTSHACHRFVKVQNPLRLPRQTKS
jgi:hypothetical protein